MTHRSERRRRLGLVAGLAGTLVLAGHSSRAADCPPLPSGEGPAGSEPAVVSALDAGCGVQAGKAIRVALNAPATARAGAVPGAGGSRAKAKLPPLVLQIFSSTSGVAAHPQAQVSVPVGYKLIGGGARVNSTGAGNLLTASYPDGRSWIARSKDQDIPDPATVTAFAVGLFDPHNQWDVRTSQATGAVANAPMTAVSAPTGYVMTGGGARVNDTGAGNLLTASFPASRSTWVVSSTDHIEPDPASITAYAIGIRARNGARGPRMVIATSDTAIAAHPSGSVSIASPFQLSGGGAIEESFGGGNLLTAIFPSGANQWSAAGKDHEIADPASLALFAIGLAR